MELQGAEATVSLDERVVKRREAKQYRHPGLDSRIRSGRTAKESEMLKKASRAGARVPDVHETSEYVLEMERIEGSPLKQVVEDDPELLEDAGRNIAALHSADIVHGDLTTSNMIVSGDELYLIDFGLAERSRRTEDRAVDIHLLRQTLRTSHPGVSQEAWESFRSGYSDYDNSEEVLDRLEEIEQRGRYK